MRVCSKLLNAIPDSRHPIGRPPKCWICGQVASRSDVSRGSLSPPANPADDPACRRARGAAAGALGVLAYLETRDHGGANTESRPQVGSKSVQTHPSSPCSAQGALGVGCWSGITAMHHRDVFNLPPLGPKYGTRHRVQKES